MNDELVERLRGQQFLSIGNQRALQADAADRIEALTAQLTEARESERAAVVAWLRGLHWTHVHNQEALFFATAIEDKVHLT